MFKDLDTDVAITDLAAAVMHLGANPEAPDDMDNLLAGISAAVRERGMPPMTTVEIEAPDDALLINVDGGLWELKYPFTLDDFESKLNAIQDGDEPDF
jgi:hypothetical protein